MGGGGGGERRKSEGKQEEERGVVKAGSQSKGEKQANRLQRGWAGKKGSKNDAEKRGGEVTKFEKIGKKKIKGAGRDRR